jgi:acetyl esterase/lipase
MKLTRRAYTYKTAGECRLKADVYRPAGEKMRPVILWIHGGALILGNRQGIARDQFEAYLDAGFTIVSMDYRLAPETQLPDIIADLRAAGAWLRAVGRERLGVDPERLAVIGHSAGGYLTLMAGVCFAPRPKALVAFYGYGDIIGPWLSRPSAFYRRDPLITRSAALAAIGQKPVASDFRRGNRQPFYRYCRQQGIWPKQVSGFDPRTQRDRLLPFCPERHVTAAYPPTLLLHGDKDTDVPYAQSVRMARALARAGVEHELITIPGDGHGFDPFAAGVFGRVVAFLHRHLG